MFLPLLISRYALCPPNPAAKTVPTAIRPVKMKMSRLARPDRRTTLPIIVTPMKAATKQMGEKTQAYCVFSSPLKKYDRAMVLLLKRIITTAVGATTCTQKGLFSNCKQLFRSPSKTTEEMKTACFQCFECSAAVAATSNDFTSDVPQPYCPSAAVPASIPYVMTGHTTTDKFGQGISYAASQRVAHERGTGGVVGLPGGPCPVAEGRD